MKREQEGFRFKSFMIELILAHLADAGLDFSDYPEALQHFFTYVARSNIRELIVFGDYYSPRAIGSFSEPVKIIDPSTPRTMSAQLYTEAQAAAIVDAALDAGDAIDAALAAPTKQETVSLLAEGVRLGISRGETIMSDSYTISESESFTVTHARHMAAKVATDLKRMQRLYGSPKRCGYRAVRGRDHRVPESRLSRDRMVWIPAGWQLDRADAALHCARPCGIGRQ